MTEKLVFFLRERVEIQRRKDAGAPRPWTTDPILRDGKFCNIEREQDRTARVVAEQWRTPHADDPDLIVAMAISVRINHAKTITEMGWPLPWPGEAAEKLMARHARGEPCTNQRAYRTLGGSPRGMELIPGFVRFMFPALWNARDFLRPVAGESCASVYRRLTTLHGWGEGQYGSFLAAQVIAATKFAGTLRNAPDFATFVVSGPGSRPGLAVALGRPAETQWRDEAHWRAAFDPLFKSVIKPEAALLGIELSASDGQNLLCEYSKYVKWTAAGTPGIRYTPFDEIKATKPRPRKPPVVRPSVSFEPPAPAPAPILSSYVPQVGAPVLFFDCETRSGADLRQVGAHRYAADPTTQIVCIGFAVDAGDVEIWTPGQPIPGPFLEAAHDSTWRVVAHHAAFERAIEEHILERQHGWPHIPLEQHRCTMSAALATALPGSLEAAAAALGLAAGKDRVGADLMRRMARPLYLDPSSGAPVWFGGPAELERLFAYCQRDAAVTRELFARLPPLSEEEQKVWQFDSVVNERGFHVDRPLAEAARELARMEQIAIDTEIAELTGGTITTANQVGKIADFVRERGHQLKTLSKRSVAAILARSPGEEVGRLLELRRSGAQAAARKLETLLAGLNSDDRLRGTLRYYGAATGRWSGRGFQPQNLKRPETKDIDAAIAAVLTGDIERVRKLGSPLSVIGDVSRSIVCAAPGHVLMGADFSAIESRVLAWLAGETWKIESYREFDRTGDPALEPYCVTASRILRRTVTPADEAGRAIGKTCDLAFGYGGGLGAWRKFDSSGDYSDAEVERFKSEWRRAHPATVRCWRALERAAHRAVLTGQRIELDRVAFAMEAGTLFMTLPSGRRLAYPEARLAPGKFDGTRELVFKDNAKGNWTDRSAWYGTLVENLVQATARDLLAGAMLRLEAAGFQISLHIHDEVVAEVPESSGNEQQFLELMTELPAWARGLPIAAKAWTSRRYSKSKAAREATAPDPAATETAAPLIAPATEPQATQPPIGILEVGHLCGSDSLHNPPATRTPQAINGSVPRAPDKIAITAERKICCPFHAERTPSCQVYSDGHFHCFGCGRHGDHDELGEVAQTSEIGSSPPSTVLTPAERSARAMRLWAQTRPIAGTLAFRYLAETRGIDLAGMPDGIDGVLRFHPCCPFGRHTTHPCLVALMRNARTDAPTGIHRIALTPDARKIDRRMMGLAGVVKLWPAGAQLVLGEGIETVLAAATRIPWRGSPLRPAWAALSDGPLIRFPIIPGVERLIILVDHDHNGVGGRAADACAARWQWARRTVVKLKPVRAGTDFNDLVQKAAS